MRPFLKNFLAFIFGFFLVFGLVGYSYSADPTCVFRSVTPPTPPLSTDTSAAGYVTVAFGAIDFSTIAAIPAIPSTAPLYHYSYGYNAFWLSYWDGTSWVRKYFATGYGRYTSGFVSSFESLPYPVEVPEYQTLYPGGVGCPGVPPDCPEGSLSGDFVISGKDLSFNYCSDGCSLDSSAVAYDPATNQTFFHGSASGEPCTTGTAATPYVPPSPVVPTCPDGQIYSPTTKTCVPISSGTGTAAAPTAETFPDSTPTYNPGDTGYGTPTLPGAPSAVTGPQTTTTGIVGTTTTVVNPDGSVTETTEENKTVDPLAAPDGQSTSYNKPAKSVNFQNFNNALNGFAQGGPVRFFSDMTQVFQSIVATPAAPIFRLPLPGHTMVVDLSVFDPVAQISRIMLSIFALVALGFFLLKQWRAG